MKVSYIRVSAAEQNTARHEALMKQLGKIWILSIKKKILPNGKYKGRNPIAVNEQLIIGIR